MEAVSLAQKFSLFSDYWSPKIVAELNGQQVKVAKLKGEFIWHHHEHEDELFLVMKGCYAYDSVTGKSSSMKASSSLCLKASNINRSRRKKCKLFFWNPLRP